MDDGLDKDKDIWHKYIKSVVHRWAAAAAKSLQSCPTLWDPIDGSPPGSPVPGILQARTLEWVATSFSNAWKWKVKVKLLNRVWLPATPRTAAYQAPPSMGFPRQEYWSGLPSPSPHRRAGPILFSYNLNSWNGEQIKLFEDKPIFFLMSWREEVELELRGIKERVYSLSSWFLTSYFHSTWSFKILSNVLF